MGKSFSRLSPRIVNTLFLVLLQRYFSMHPEYTYTPDDSKTPIDIAVDYTEDDPIQKRFPLIVIQNGSISLSAAGVSSGLYQSVPRSKKVNGEIIKQVPIRDTKVQMIFNSYTNLYIYAESKDDADELAFEIATLLMCCRPIIADILQIQNISDMQIQAANPVARTGWIGKYMATINIPYTGTVSRFVFPVDRGVLLRAIETTMEPANHGTVPKAGDLTQNCIPEPINVGTEPENKGGTNTGGENGNWGGTGGISDDRTADGIDDNNVNLRFRVIDDTTTGNTIINEWDVVRGD